MFGNEGRKKKKKKKKKGKSEEMISFPPFGCTRKKKSVCGPHCISIYPILVEMELTLCLVVVMERKGGR